MNKDLSVSSCIVGEPTGNNLTGQEITCNVTGQVINLLDYELDMNDFAGDVGLLI